MKLWVVPDPSLRSIPIPAFEQVGDGELEAGQEMFAFQHGAGTEQLPVGRRVANFDAFIVRIDDPANLSSARKEILQPAIDLRAAIAINRVNYHK